MAEENRSTHKVYEKDKIGEVQIADEVVEIIEGLAATEVEGVDSMAGNITNELVGKLGMKNLSKGVKVDVTEEHVDVYKRQVDVHVRRLREKVEPVPSDPKFVHTKWGIGYYFAAK